MTRQRVLTLGLAAAFALSWAGAGFAQAIDTTLWVTNGQVNAVVRSGGIVYLGGNFTQVGPATGSGLPIDTATGSLPASFPKVTGHVLAVAPDGAGGWYIGGQFTAVGGLPRSNLAHLGSDLSVSAWAPNSSAIVRALVVSGSTVYVGGGFTSIGGQARNRIAALDATSGTATAWNPNANGGVYALAVSGSTVYAGGEFTSIGGQTRNSIAALDSTGAATAWDPNASCGFSPCSVNALALGGSTVYAGGFFNSIGGQPRNYIAALDDTIGAATAWNPNADLWVFAIAVSGSTVYAGGDFASIGGQLRNRIAALDASTGSATAWNPNASHLVRALAVSGSTVYAGGGFVNIGGQPRNRIAALDTTSGLATTWNPNANLSVYAIAVSGSTVYAGGQFTSMGGVARNYIAALDAATGTATAWNPNAGSTVNALEVSGSTVYAGGSFTSMGGQTRNHIAALDATTGTATTWNPNIDDQVFALAVNGSAVYAGGDFTSAGGQPRSRIAAVDATSGLATPWNPNADGQVRALRVSGSTVYAGGDFLNIGGQVRHRVAAVDTATGTASAWNPNADSTVRALAVSGSTIYAGGLFDNIGGQARNRIAALDAATGTATAWNPSTNGYVYTLAVSGSTVYAGGIFGGIGGQPRNHLGALNAATGTATAWNPSPAFPQGVFALAVGGSTVHAGGYFLGLGVLPRAHIAAIWAVPDLESVSPTSGGNSGAVTLSLAGHHLRGGATVKLARMGQPDIIGTGVSVAPNGLGLTAAFDLTGTALGAWDVVVAAPDSQSATLANGFTIEALEAPQLQIELVGPTAFRAGHPAPFDLVVENEGNVDAVGVPVWLAGIPSDATVGLDFPLSYPPQSGGEPDWTTVPLSFTSEEGQYVTLVIPKVAPGSEVRRIHLTVPSDRTFSLVAAVTPPWADGTVFRSCLGTVVSSTSCLGTQLTGIAGYLAANPGIEALSGVGVWAKVAWQCEGAGTLEAALVEAEQALDYLVARVEQETAAPGCGDVVLPRWKQELGLTAGSSFDPNDKLGPEGMVSLTQAIPYSVRFENLSGQLAAAQRVIVTDVLEEGLDLSTVSLGPIAFGSVRLVPPPGLKQYAQDVDLGASVGVVVRVSAGPPNAITRQLVWSFTSLDRTTGLPLDPSSLNGFLPPNETPPEGEGSVLFTVRPASGVSGTIENSATIEMDQSVLSTPPVENALDLEAPASHVLSLAAPTDSAFFTVQWESPGSPADLKDYTVYVSHDGGSYRAWRENSVATADTFAVLLDDPPHVYAFYSVARDESGNVEAAPGSPDAQTAYTTGVEEPVVWRLGLEGARPNPARGTLQAWFTLEGVEPAVLELIDVAGRRVERRAVGALGAGRHGVTLGPTRGLPSGLYFLRLIQGDRTFNARVALLR